MCYVYTEVKLLASKNNVLKYKRDVINYIVKRILLALTLEW
jgi:hypothetical protein